MTPPPVRLLYVYMEAYLSSAPGRERRLCPPRTTCACRKGWNTEIGYSATPEAIAVLNEGCRTMESCEVLDQVILPD
jgi:hypothetical protein